MVSIHPVQESEISCCDYRVRVNGIDLHNCENIAVSGLYHNGERVTELPPERFETNEYCENITIE